ncbi:SusD/RagB family nutrient-binding outer membrane lipoprotein [Aureisphaera galaxeae]|uniref:SusD/RagB family nutrient-binding outer membrane lipoprotein n=1 Tax=Aureisphaera galaxeae TaxID=1538023 RepID=UPI00235029DB|nr:SusD/RagB family nutrient-binding outer membrane lipoprotein [Aureisphaera galaxeae]MDC8005590.1 SusD/RagB family nutrient-binding outer membrane lipoprotein [Aureisphaera galaxeae]
MKKLNKISAIVFLLLGLAFTSCETTDLDLLEDPNEITTDNASLDRFLTRIQIDFASFIRQQGRNGAQLTRMEYMFGRTYVNNYQPVALDGEWTLAYQNMFSDMAAAEPIAVANENFLHLGVMRILKGYTLITLVDNFGDVPFSQATNPTEFPAPVADPGQDVYTGAIALIDEGIDFLNQGGTPLENDFYYGNNADQWRKLGNSVKMQAYLANGNTAAFNAIANSPGMYISSSADDFEWQYGTNEANPDTRHPGYNADYNTSGAGRYRANWIMHTMLELGDPRMRYYFYRQNDCTPGASCDPDGNQVTLNCSVAPRPVHFPNDMIYCSVEDGYWGRDHGDNNGIPPDSFLRTAGGVYPYGGRFDDDTFGSATVGSGGGGAGIVPIMLASYTDLMVAEAALAAGNNGAAQTALQGALTKSIAKVQGFGNLDSDADDSFEPTSAEVNAYINTVTGDFASANNVGKWEILGNQNFITHYGNGLNPYNFYRRTGYPNDGLQFVIDPSPGGFVRSFFYPANEANVNANITQKPNVGVQVFWDNNPPSPGFPPAN